MDDSTGPICTAKICAVSILPYLENNCKIITIEQGIEDDNW